MRDLIHVTRVGDHVTFGHGSIVRTATIQDDAVIGMGSMISDRAVVEEGAAIGDGAVVTQSAGIPARKVARGVLATVIGDVKREWHELWASYEHVYADLARRYPMGLREVERE